MGSGGAGGKRIRADVRRLRAQPRRQDASALFGSYGWGDGEWMRSWEKDCGDAGLNLVCESVTCCDAPDDAALEACRELGRALAK